MKPFMTAQEIADAALPDLPHTKRGIQLKADANGWKFRPRQGRGGGKEYAIQNLPDKALMELRFRDIEAAAEKTKTDDPRFDYCADEKVSARAAIVLLFNDFAMGSTLTKTQAFKAFSRRYCERDDFGPPWVRRAIPVVSPRSLRRWLTTARKEGIEGLNDKQRGPKGQNRFEQDANLNSYIVAQIAGRPHVAATHIYAGIKANFENPPSLRSLQLYVKKYRAENASALLYAANPDQWKSQHRAAFGSLSENVVRLNQKWEIDGTIADVQCIGPDGKYMRYSLVALVDVFSRRAKVLVTEQPSAIATAACLRSAILDWGLPEVLKADNGKDYTAAHVVRIAADLGFHIDYCTPFSPEQKPHVERFFGTLTRELFEIIPGFVGHSVADQQAIRSRKSMAQRHGASKAAMFTLGPGELQIVINEWLRDVYERRTHSGIKTTPFQKAIGQRARMIGDERALDLLLAPPVQGDGVRKVQKKGVSVYGRWFMSPELGGLVGERVSVRLDIEDEGRVVIYSADTKEFVCVAEDPTLTGADRQDIAARARHAQAAKLRDLKAQQKAATAAHNPDKLSSEILGHAAQSASKVKAIRAPYVETVPPSMERAREAAAAIDNPQQPPPLSKEDEEAATIEIKKMEAETRARNATPFTVLNPDPTVRPNFAYGTQGEIDFWNWAQTLKAEGHFEGELTEELAEWAEELREMENDHTTQLLLLSHGVVTKDQLRKKGMYK